MTTIDKDEIASAYEEVRKDGSTVTWMLCKYEGNNIVLAGTGEDFEELRSQLREDERAFAFARLIVGDEMSKRVKFVLITWLGSGVSAMKKAKLSTDKAFVKDIIKNFAVEIMAHELDEIKLDLVKQTLEKAGGANYGTGSRD